MWKKTENPRKAVVRNTEQPLKALNPIVSKHPGRYSACQVQETLKQPKVTFTQKRSVPAGSVAPQTKSGRENAFARPELHTTLKIQHKIEAIKQGKGVKIEVNPEVLTSAREEISKKLNFGLHTKIYKNLAPINVNDSVIERDERPFRKKYVTKSQRDPTPKLQDFLTPIEPHQYPLPILMGPVKIRPIKSSVEQENNRLYRDQLKILNHFGQLS
ncbi:hypothetical protein DMENIID0001_061650 [Sergentomyia squamirostris]